MLHTSTFEFLKPTQAEIEQMATLRSAAASYAEIVDRNLPDGADKTYALRKIREAAMWINVAVTRNSDGSPRSK